MRESPIKNEKKREKHFLMAESEQITYQVTTSQSWLQNMSRIFVSGYLEYSSDPGYSGYLDYSSDSSYLT